MGYQNFAPGQSFADATDAVLAQTASDLLQKGHSLADARVHMTVTGRNDDEVEIVRERAALMGFGSIILVDDRQPARPGTVSSATLDPLAASGAAEARAARLPGNKFG
ncbi:hypothetical protein [Nocardia sp. XZ_19_369]|uniref:hypothetical protein n=1 Tax=Nocardia sp. XZ_19_369 TaxID=2769487 RepID=UPI00188E4928|nr:hypothetical protein [Nocardia sp. XZ_19_369]